MSQEWAHRFVSVCSYHGKGYSRCNIKVTAGLHHISGNQRPHFSVTAEIYRPKARDIEAGGCLHADVLRYWPKLAPVVKLHLSDDTGQPLHAEANGWYWLAGFYGGADARYHGGNGTRQHWKADGSFDGYRASTPDECLDMFADHVRLPIEEARTLAVSFRAIADSAPAGVSPQAPYWTRVREAFSSWLATQAPRFQQEADAATALLDALILQQSHTSTAQE